jgi:TetR/AcrR family transcriptional regulator, ethionamide resistance regulator
VLAGAGSAGSVRIMTSGARDTTKSDKPRRFDDSLRKGDRRREQLLDVAERLLQTHSPSELTIERVARAAGVSRSSLYFYFQGKWAIVDQLIEQASQEMFERNLADEAPDLASYLRAMVMSAAVGWREHRAVFLAATERSAHADEATDRWRSIMGRFADDLARRIDEEPACAPAVAALGGSRAAAEIACWMVERNLFMHYSRPREDTDVTALVEALTVAMVRVVGIDPAT